MTQRSPLSARTRWGLIAGAAVVLCALPALVLGTGVDTWAERALASMSGGPAMAGLVVGLLALDTVLPVPSSVLATFAGERLGFAGATGAIFAGLCLGNVVGYLIGRLAASPLVERLVGPDQLAWAQTKVGTRPGAVALLVTRPIPILSEAAVVLAGGARARIGRVATVLVPANAGLAIVYAGLGSAAHDRLALPLGLAGVVGVPLVAIAAAAVLDARRRHVGPVSRGDVPTRDWRTT